MLTALGLRRRHRAHPRLRVGGYGYIQLDFSQELPIGIKYLNSVITAVRNVNVSLCIRSNAVGCIELSGLIARFAPGFDPVAVFIELRHARIDVTVADEDVPLRIPGDVGRLPELAVNRRQWRVGVLPGFGAFI